MTEREKKKKREDETMLKNGRVGKNKLLFLERIGFLQDLRLSFSHFPFRLVSLFSADRHRVYISLPDSYAGPSQRLIQPVRDYLLPM